VSRIMDRDFDYDIVKKHFDNVFYLINYPDVADAAVDPVVHYLDYGHAEHRDPSPNFSTERYLSENADVREAGVNGFVHYLRYGRREQRQAIAPAFLAFTR